MECDMSNCVLWCALSSVLGTMFERGSIQKCYFIYLKTLLTNTNVHEWIIVHYTHLFKHNVIFSFLGGGNIDNCQMVKTIFV